MQKFVGFFTAFLFFIWILPLGIFIKPAQEKIACDGQRAICLCSHLVAKQIAKNAGKAAYKPSRTAEPKESNGPGGFSHYYLFAQRTNSSNKQITFYHQQQSSLYSLIVVRLIDQVPKV